jgi:hypothetical protein
MVDVEETSGVKMRAARGKSARTKPVLGLESSLSIDEIKQQNLPLLIRVNTAKQK